MKYDEYMDEECIELCDCLNSLPGVETFESCCGHLRSEYHVWLRCSDWDSLSILSRACSWNYGGYPWTLSVDHTDTRPCLCFRLESETYPDYGSMKESVGRMIGRIRTAADGCYLDYVHKKGRFEEK